MASHKYRYKKSYRTKKKKSIFRIFHNRFFWLGFFILVLLGGIFYFFVFSSFFQIKEFEIYGNQKVSTEEIENVIKEQISQPPAIFPKMIGGFIPRNIFLINFKEIDRTILKKFPKIARITLKRKLPDTMTANIEERISIGVWCRHSDCFRLDNEGVVFEKDVEEAGLVIKSEKEIIFGKKIIGKDYLEDILEIQKGLKDDLAINIKEFFIPHEEEKLIVRIFNNWEIYFNPKGDISDQIFNLNLVLKEKIPPEKIGDLEYIDLKFGSRVFFKYKEDSNKEDSNKEELSP